MRTVRLAITILTGAALVPLTATAALAAPPNNDTPDGARVIALGDTVKQNTTQATTDALDKKVNRSCGAPFTNASVWYTYTPSEDGSFILDASGSDYSTGLMVFEGAPTPRTLLSCGPETVGVGVTAGTTYTIMAFSDTKVNGGNLVMSLEAGPPPPTFSVSVDPVGLAYKNGSAQVSGTLTCTNSLFLETDSKLTQIWRRVKIQGYFHLIGHARLCDGQPHAWSKLVHSANGLYAPGKATVRTTTQACGQIECTDREKTTSHIMLQASPKSVPARVESERTGLLPAAARTGLLWPTG